MYNMVLLGFSMGSLASDCIYLFTLDCMKLRRPTGHIDLKLALWYCIDIKPYFLKQC